MRPTRARRRESDAEEGSAFVSMTDLTISFLFIVILLLAYYASKYNPEKTVALPVHQHVVAERDAALKLARQLRPAIEERDAARQRVAQLEEEVRRLQHPNPLEQYIHQSMDTRRHILETLQQQLTVTFPDLKVSLSEQGDALHFQGDGLFASGSAMLRPERVNIVRAIGRRLQQILPCYTLGPQADWKPACNPDSALIEAVQIEGHTDTDGHDQSNLILSTNRADETFRVMVDQEPGLVGHLSYQKQPVLSVAGYGSMRPIAPNDTREGKAINRRIDLRLIMYVPAQSADIARIGQILEGNVR